MISSINLVNAEQKNYIQTNVLTITKLVTTVLQIIILLVSSNFLFYLLTAAFVELVQKIYVSHYLNKLYPYLKDKNVIPLGKEERDEIVYKTKALVCHKVGDVARLQNDSIIISSFIQVSLVGIVDNYTMVINSISNFVNIIFNSVISSFGNLIALILIDYYFKGDRIVLSNFKTAAGVFEQEKYLALIQGAFLLSNK